MEEIREKLSVLVGELFLEHGLVDEVLEINRLLDNLVLLEMKKINSDKLN